MCAATVEKYMYIYFLKVMSTYISVQGLSQTIEKKGIFPGHPQSALDWKISFHLLFSNGGFGIHCADSNRLVFIIPSQ